MPTLGRIRPLDKTTAPHGAAHTRTTETGSRASRASVRRPRWRRSGAYRRARRQACGVASGTWRCAAAAGGHAAAPRKNHSLPAHPFETDVLRAVRSGKTPYVRFDRNQYSIPHTHVRRPLTLVASATTVRLLDGQTELARHRRSYDTGQTIEDAAHLEGLLVATHQANIHTARDRLRVAVPATAPLFDRLAARGEALRPHTVRLLALLDDYGPQELAAAIATALTRDALGAGSIAHLLEIRRRQQGRTPPLPLALPNRPGVRDLDVRPHRLESYDALTRRPDDPDE